MPMPDSDIVSKCRLTAEGLKVILPQGGQKKSRKIGNGCQA
jgi:hypothetical protein